MNRKISFIVIVLIAITSCNHPLRGDSNQTRAPQQNSPSVGTGTSGGVTWHYILHVPYSYQQGNAVALILNFHGYGSNSQQEENLTGMSAKADREGFIVVYPDGLNNAWHDGPGADGAADQQFIRDLIAALESQYTIDPKRIYATGISNGGGMANRVGCDMADVFAAIAPDSGTYKDCNPARPMPVLAFHGLDDHIVPHAGGAPKAMEPPVEEWAASWGTRNRCSATPNITTPVDGVTVRTWSGCKSNADVILYTLVNHGHSWPGSPVMPKAITSQAVNATDVMWEFFKAHPMP